MTPGEELKSLIVIRDTFSKLLISKELKRESHALVRRVLEATNERVHLLLDTMNSEDTALREKNRKTIEETRSKWYDDVCMTILKALAAKAISDHIHAGLIRVIHSFWSL